NGSDDAGLGADDCARHGPPDASSDGTAGQGRGAGRALQIDPRRVRLYDHPTVMAERTERPIANVDELVAHFRAGAKPRSAARVGMEHEKIAVLSDGRPAD